MKTVEEKAGLGPRSKDELAAIDAVGRDRIAEAREVRDAGDAAGARKLLARIVRDFRGVPSGDEAKRLQKEWKQQ